MTQVHARWLAPALLLACLQVISPAAHPAANQAVHQPVHQAVHQAAAPRCGDRGAKAEPPKAGAIFNDPMGKRKAKYRITVAIRKNINGTPRGGVIRLATLRIDVESVVGALLRADDCGVGVRVLVPGRAWQQESVVRLRRNLGTDTTQNSWVSSCESACTSSEPGGVMHAKLHLFSRVVHADGVAQDVTTYSSGNLVHSQSKRRHNDAYQLVGNAAVFAAARSYFDDMAADGEPTYATLVRTPGHRQYFLPPEDLHRDVFDRTSCPVGRGTTSVDLVASIWKRVDVAEQLVDLHEAGCRVRVVLAVDRAEQPVLRTLHRHGVPTHVQTKREGHKVLHGKYIAIRGSHRGKQVHTVYCGSLNVSRYSARRANNVMIRAVDDEAVYGDYQRNFTKLWEGSRPLTKADVRAAGQVDAARLEKQS